MSYLIHQIKSLFGLGSSNRGIYRDYSIRPLLKQLIWMVLLVSILIILSLLFFYNVNGGFVLFTVALLMAAYLVGGVVLGFIFGIPKKLQTKQQPQTLDKDGKPVLSQNGDSESEYKDNTSLEEISDWLTKIIIGLSLVQFNKILTMLTNAANYISKCLVSACCYDKASVCKVDFTAFSFALIIFYLIMGGVIGYLWTRLLFPFFLKQKDDHLKKDFADLQKHFFNEQNNVEIDEVAETEEKQEEILTVENNTTEAKTTNTAENDFNSNSTETLQNEKSEIVKRTTTSFERIKEFAIISKFQKVIDDRPEGRDKADPQRGRWGGKETDKGFKLKAEVKPHSIPTFYEVKLIITSTNDATLPGEVAFVLHPDFEPSLRVFKPVNSKEVFITLVAYEAFAVGAICMFGNNELALLELDLNQLKDVPKGFKW